MSVFTLRFTGCLPLGGDSEKFHLDQELGSPPWRLCLRFAAGHDGEGTILKTLQCLPLATVGLFASR
jgi:hypothetical protein